jgi:hypothetical protein
VARERDVVGLGATASARVEGMEGSELVRVDDADVGSSGGRVDRLVDPTEERHDP